MKFWTKAFGMEAFKFAVYLIVPAVTTVYCTNPKFMKELVLRLNLVEYPRQAEWPDQKELQDIANKNSKI